MNRKGALVVTVVQIGYRIDMHIQREICRYTLWLQGELPEDFLVIHLQEHTLLICLSHAGALIRCRSELVR